MDTEPNSFPPSPVLTLSTTDFSSIAAACEKQLGLEIDKKKMVLPEPIKACGTTIVPVKLHREVTAKLTVKVQEA